MRYLKRYCIFFFLFSLVILLLEDSACTKEYSYERSNMDTSRTDTADTDPSLPPATFPQCSLCNPSDSLKLGQWSFKTGNAYMCGTFSSSGFFADAKQMSF